MRVYRRGKVYWFELVFNGERIQQSTKSTNQRIAGQIASAYHTALVRGEAGILERKRAPAFDTAMANFLAWSKIEHRDHPGTTSRYEDSSLALLRYFKKTPLDRISAEDVESFKTRRSAEYGKHTGRQLRPATVNRELACLRILFNEATKGVPDLRNPVDRINFLDEDNLQERVPTYAEQRAYLAVASELVADVVGLIAETGARPGEIFVLHTSHVRLDEFYFRVLKGKTPAARRRIDLNEAAHAILTKRVARAGKSGLLFPKDNDPYSPVESLQSSHNAALRASGVPHFRIYDIRHMWATRAAETIDLVTLAAMMGHSRIQMVMRYAHPTQLHQSNATQKIAAHNREREAIERAKLQLEVEDREKQLKPFMVPKRLA